MKVQELLQTATDVTNNLAEKLENFNEKMASKISDNSKEALPNVVQEKVEILKLEQIKEVTNAHRPHGANELAAYYAKGKDSYLLFLTFLNDRKMLPTDQNKLIVIESEAVSREVENLMSENKVVIIK